MVSGMNKYYKELVSNTYEDIDESILACMAAGVPLSEITLTGPRVWYSDNVAAMSWEIGKGECSLLTIATVELNDN